MTKTSASSSKTASTASAKAAKAEASAAKTPAKPTAKPATKKASSVTAKAPAEAKTVKPPVQAPAKSAEAAVSAKSVATGRSSSKISTSDNMPTPATKVDTKLANAWKTKAGKDLTEAELLAMPESEYMSDKQLDFFRACLEAQKEDLLSNAGETTEHLREDTSIVPDPADRATIEEEHALELRTRDRERKLLKKISQALVRIDSGEYGFCDETGEPIGLGRLLARPTATLSLEAQQRRELKQKMFGD
ncbi:MAG TPA: RNA polymerase-binding protein DksA [Aquabacterium sp.]|uniref:RNA polymerase-binding protein DksA n=2 Tax=Aquabacterium sp. TaxID=1872578 RepID=UPI002E2F107B|nr:RNA polymerase-binding protein DksA [Aquabacterium sp.]HEX5357570.1 RNA polymerase-binding protein DksA [Aquabacterium sp.]